VAPTSKDVEESPVSQVEQARVARAANQVVAYANFLRWTTNFSRDEILRHPRHDRVMLLSPMQSGRFSFACEGDTLYIGVQDFEAAWVQFMPFDAAYVSDRLYLSADSVVCMEARMHPLSIGFFVDDSRKRAQMASAAQVQFVRVQIQDGHVAAVGELCGVPIPIKAGDVVQQLYEQQQTKLRQQDMGRFF